VGDEAHAITAPHRKQRRITPFAIAAVIHPVALGPADLDACHQLDQRALGGLWSREQWARELEEPRRPCLGLREGPDLVAMASGWLVVDELHITAVAVAPERRQQGLGRLVLEALLNHGAALGAVHATLEVAADNAAALALYARQGFQTAGIRRHYYRNGEDALIQWRRVQGADVVRISGHS
jgi:[ribosomal protein S18]-alanine N-acetyltransferase